MNKLKLFSRMSTTTAKISLRNEGTLLFQYMYAALICSCGKRTEVMANIKLDKNVIVSFRFTVADGSRLLVYLPTFCDS